MSQSSLPDLNGLLVVDKPAGVTSHDVVARVRRMVGMKRVGHGGTLDPFATGVVVVAVGRATRVLQYVQNSDKGYRAHVVLGASTDSGDIDGAFTKSGRHDTWPTADEVSSALATFIGTIEQSPPVYSAIKVGGRKLYELARAGEAVDVPTRIVTIYAIELVRYDPPDVILDIHCGKGTYIRSIARDLGICLGTEAYCHSLRRTNSGGICLADAWTLDELAERDIRASWHTIALHPDAALGDLPVVVLGSSDQEAWYHGRSVILSRRVDPAMDIVRVYGEHGRFLGVGGWIDRETLKPSMVMAPESEGEST